MSELRLGKTSLMTEFQKSVIECGHIVTSICKQNDYFILTSINGTIIIVNNQYVYTKGGAKVDRERLGGYLKALRGNRTQKEVAEAVGVTAMAISQYEQGERIPNDEMKIKLARYFQRSVEEIFFPKK